LIRIVQIALLLAVMIPLGMAIRWGVTGLPERGKDIGFGVVIGIAICYAFWMWDNRIRQREGADRRGD